MTAADLDNPVWSSLHGRHRAIALRDGDVVRFPADVAPFVAVRDADRDVADALATLVGREETVYLLGVPPRVPAGWSLKAYGRLAQMTRAAPLEEIDGPPIRELGAGQRADVLELTALVYPHYFRPRTMDMGRYLGIYLDGRLAAMIGERLATDANVELSAICTHPAFNGRGLARQLIARLANENLAQGRVPFLHVSRENLRALGLYERMGFTHRPGIGFWSLRRGPVA